MKGLYIHIPFCIKKCSYCDFVSYTNCNEIYEPYINAVLREAEQYRGEDIDTVFIGGGTPTVLPPELILKLLRGIYRCFCISGNAEITTECNPGTITPKKIKALIDGGVNRISVGIQSFNDDELKRIGRIHSAETAYNTVCALRENGFKNISIDLMTALPGQTPESLMYSLKAAVDLPINHISAYSLIIEAGTPLNDKYLKGEIHVPDEETDREMYYNTVDFLAKHGFNRYEISNFSKVGFECKHNIKYWDCMEYIGLGAAAHSYVSHTRYSNTTDINEYISGGRREYISLTREDEISEFMMLGLRKSSGVSADDFHKRFNKTITDVFGGELERFISLGLMEHIGGNYRLTERGIDVSNSVMCEFMLNF